MLNFLKRSFFTGLILALPVGITFFFVDIMLRYIGQPASNIIFCWLDISIRNIAVMNLLLNTVSIIFVLLIIVAIGAFSKFFFGRLIFSWTEKLINHLPFVNAVYKTVKQVAETFGKNHKDIFSKTVLIEYPKEGCYAIGFLTSETEGEVQYKTGQVVVNVFVPTTPNPTSGFLLMIPREKVVDLDMSVADGMKLIISGGIFVPPYKK